MRLMKRALMRGVLIYLLLDVLLAYAAARLLSDREEFELGVFLVCFIGLWLVLAATALRRWIYTGVTTWLARGDMIEAYRRRMVEAGIPPPPKFDPVPNNHLSQVADDATLPDSVRLGAMAILCEIVQAPANKGFLVGYFMHEAASEALNRLR